MIKEQSADNIIHDSMMLYSAETLLNRAIPTLQDGLKPSQRRILFTFYRNKYNRFTKSATVSGAVSAIHPHGNSYPTMVNMTQTDKNNISYFTGRGNYGQFTSKDLVPAAERYTEIKMSKFGQEMTKDLQKNIVPMVDNFDGTIQEPIVIPVSFPTILLYYSSGIGVGFSSTILPFNMRELFLAIKSYVKNGKFKTIYPDFATGGNIISDKKEMNKIIETGKGGVKVRATFKKIDNQHLSVVEIPFGSKREQIITKIIDLAKNNTLKDVRDVKDLTDFNGINIEISVKRGTDVDELISSLCKLTDLEIKINTNFNMIDLKTGTPEVLGVKSIIDRWLNWRSEVYKRDIVQQINSINTRMRLYNGLKVILSDIDKYVDMIRSSAKSNIKKNIKKEAGLDDDQIDYILNMKLYNINKDYINSRIEEINSLEKELNQLQQLVNNSEQILNRIIKEMDFLSKTFTNKRHTLII